jgi:hypothetical protein
MAPNAWADFCAGVVAPIAFLWLVLGYYQQGDELKQNTQALKLQEEELHNQVAETQNLVRATLQMAEAAAVQAAAAAEQAKASESAAGDARERAKPRLVISDTYESSNPQFCELAITNQGGSATVLDIHIWTAGQAKNLPSSFPKGQPQKIRLPEVNLMSCLGGNVECKLLDEIGIEHLLKYQISWNSANELRLEAIK